MNSLLASHSSKCIQLYPSNQKDLNSQKYAESMHPKQAQAQAHAYNQSTREVPKCQKQNKKIICKQNR